MESQPQNPELRNKPENFHPCKVWPNMDLSKSWQAFVAYNG